MRDCRSGRAARAIGLSIAPTCVARSQAVDPNLQQLAKAWEEMSERLSDDQLRELEARQQVREGGRGKGGEDRSGAEWSGGGESHKERTNETASQRCFNQ